jgi:hypothetical protein
MGKVIVTCRSMLENSLEEKGNTCKSCGSVFSKTGDICMYIFTVSINKRKR